MLKKTIQVLAVILILLMIGSALTFIGGFATLLNPPEERLSKNSILQLDLNGIIFDSKDFVEKIVKYRKDDHIKGILIHINSPGGVVGPSQEIYEEIKRTAKDYKKPVYAYCSAVAASGAYYSAVGADKIFTTPGCTMGSIGVIMELVNLEKLYEWAKVQRYAITTGPYKDAGAEYKPLTPDQRSLFQTMLNSVLGQFKKAVAEGRKMKMEELDKYADGRVFTGEDAVKMGFADQIGTFEDAKAAIGEATGLGKEPEIFHPKKKKGLMALFEDGGPGGDKDDMYKAVLRQVFHPELRSTPLFIMPGSVGL